MSIFDSKTGYPSSRLAKGIAKEKEVAQYLRYKYPTATVTRTSQTADGGKDIILNRGGKTVYYEVKNWSRSMSVYDVKPYIEMQRAVDAEMEVYNKGGFSSGARSAAEAAGVNVTAGSEYTAPGVATRLQWATTRARTAIISATKRITMWCAGIFGLLAETGEQLITHAIQAIVAVGLAVADRLSPRHIAMFGMILGPIWFIYRLQSDEYGLQHLVLPTILTFGFVLGYFLLDD